MSPRPPRPPERHFRTVWNISMIHVAVMSVLWIHELTGLALFDPAILIRDLAVWSFAWFLAPEWAAGGVRGGRTGTKTGYLYWVVEDRWSRVLLGVWMALLMGFNFPNDFLSSPDWLPVGYILGGILLLWLPPHYWARGTVGPFDRAVIWFAKRTGLEKLYEKVRS